MDTMEAFLRAQIATASKSRIRVFDWRKAAIYLNTHDVVNAVAGLSTDMEFTLGAILAEGHVVPASDTYTYLASNWAVPVLVPDYEDELECWAYEEDTPGWGPKTYWPAEALALLDERYAR